MVPFSYPLTIMVYADQPIDYTVDVLTHELIHQLFVQNDKGGAAYESWAHIFRKYKQEPFNTQIHISVYAVHHEIFSRLLTEKRLKREMDACGEYAEYKRFWDRPAGRGGEHHGRVQGEGKVMNFEPYFPHLNPLPEGEEKCIILATRCT